jgi:hypothetical protein
VILPCLRRHDRQSCYPRRPWNGRNFVTITPTQGLASPQSRIGSLLGYVKDSMAPVWKSTQCGFADTIPKAADDHDYIGQHSEKVMRSVWASRKLMFKDRKRCAIGVYCVARIDMKQQLMQSGRVCLRFEDIDIIGRKRRLAFDAGKRVRGTSLSTNFACASVSSLREGYPRAPSLGAAYPAHTVYGFVMWLVSSTSHKSTSECWLRLDPSGISGHARPRGCAALYGP